MKSPRQISQLYVCFFFSSGAGGWATELFIAEDGSFEGHFHDGDLGVTGPGYSHGTMYYCDFTGHFGEPEYVDDYTVKAELLENGFAEDVCDKYLVF